ncbi:glycoside hydrolase family 43 protein [Dyella sp. EPa41]|uniref:glycoside hydrolase family 43 protein n=1 Tax=Dyella sp. EPa41 TaxID=1561194 RepID=UPI0019155EE8|nr:glycoside hydrolase family 43 protein [Dyella sp. EPa41]
MRHLLRRVACGLTLVLGTAAHAQEPVLFDWFEYRGHDAAFDQPLPPGHYTNPVLAGFSPDPSIVRVGEHYYLVNSSFAYFPGIPVYESRDLVHWAPIGHVIDRPSQLRLDGLGMSRGVYAPAIAHHDGTFFVINTAVDSGGNFIATADNPAGPWSDPVWLPELADGIDPSLFFDDNGKAYIVNNGVPAGGSRYDGHRAIWMQEFDIARHALTGPRRVLLDGGVDPAKKPIWIEGPHVYKRDGWYYLMCAEGGTGPQHSEVVLRSRAVWGPYVPYAGNPILTQRDLPADRAHPIVNAGHADLVEAQDGSWWAVFLASRAYDRVHYNTGRETFLLPVTWKDGWPSILPAGKAIPQVAKGPSFLAAGPQAPHSGNFTWRDEFDKPALDASWQFVRTPSTPWADLRSHPGQLAIEPQAQDLDTLHNPSFLARAQQHLAFDASTELVVPAQDGVEAGIAAFQNEHYWYAFGVHRAAGKYLLTVRLHRGAASELMGTAALDKAPAHLQLKISADAGRYDFAYNEGSGWKLLLRGADGSLLSTDVAGGFVGATLGPYARLLDKP